MLRKLHLLAVGVCKPLNGAGFNNTQRGIFFEGECFVLETLKTSLLFSEIDLV